MSLLDAILLDPQKLDVWIAVRTDGVQGSGTESDPYNASPRQENPISVQSLSSVVREATVTTNAAHGYADGEVVTIKGVTGTGAAQYNGRFSIYDASGSIFKYAMLSSPGASPASETISCAKVLFQFDELMWPGFAEYTTVRLGPGLFETRGFSQRWGGWYPKSGWKIIGSGIDVTTLKIVHGIGAENASAADPIGLLAIGTLIDANIVDFEASDFTIDCNLDGQPTPKTKASVAKAFPQVICGAIRVGGSRCRVRRIRAINWGGGLYDGPAPECFVLTLGWPTTTGTEAVDCVIEDCILEQPSENSANLITCIGIGGGIQWSGAGLSSRLHHPELCGELSLPPRRGQRLQPSGCHQEHHAGVWQTIYA